jgi:hypothetical protein
MTRFRAVALQRAGADLADLRGFARINLILNKKRGSAEV